ncbi:MAG: hypothetical protein NC094_00270 [Bacteroidales bacterium]|nr:hypothetical protein [Lachnoclostridium sp.]MCM1384634.1 hypothetical protein [Lachnoclostridium sp.]MCM1463827.1 hypothetical protein [Bacteroidales bacterium]
MVIEMEAYYGDCYLFGKNMSLPELKEQTNSIWNEVTESDFVSIFCARCNFEKLDSYNGLVDYVIDLDTHQILRKKS